MRPMSETILRLTNISKSFAGIHALRPFPFHRSRWQLWQMSVFADLIAKTPAPHFVVGDFNAASWGQAIKSFSRIADVKPLPSRGTWLSLMPWPLRIPIDQALVGDGVLCAKKSVGPLMYSDHRPIWIDFALKPSVAKPAP